MTIRVEIPLQAPGKLLRPIAAMIEGIASELLAEKKIKLEDFDKATHAMLGATVELLKWNLRLDGDKGSVVIELKDDAAARTIMRHAAIEAVRGLAP